MIEWKKKELNKFLNETKDRDNISFEKDVPECFKNDIEALSIIVKKHRCVYKQLDENLQKEHDIALAYFVDKKYTADLEFFPVFEDKSFMAKLIPQNTRYISEMLEYCQYDLDLLKVALVEDLSTYSYLTLEEQMKEEIYSFLIEIDDMFMEEVPTELGKDENFVNKYLLQKPIFLYRFEEHFQEKEKMYLFKDFIQQNPDVVSNNFLNLFKKYQREDELLNQLNNSTTNKRNKLKI